MPLRFPFTFRSLSGNLNAALQAHFTASAKQTRMTENSMADGSATSHHIRIAYAVELQNSVRDFTLRMSFRLRSSSIEHVTHP